MLHWHWARPGTKAPAASRAGSIKRLLCWRTAVGRPAERLQGPARCDSRIYRALERGAQPRVDVRHLRVPPRLLLRSRVGRWSLRLWPSPGRASRRAARIALRPARFRRRHASALGRRSSRRQYSLSVCGPVCLANRHCRASLRLPPDRLHEKLNQSLEVGRRVQRSSRLPSFAFWLWEAKGVSGWTYFSARIEPGLRAR